MTDPTQVAVIGGLGTGLSAHLAARLAARGYRVADTWPVAGPN